MENKFSQLDLAVSRIGDIRTVLLIWEDILTLEEVEVYTPVKVLRSLHVGVNLPGWISSKEVALTLSATRPVLEHFLEALPSEGVDVKKLWGFSGLNLRYRISPRSP